MGTLTLAFLALFFSSSAFGQTSISAQPVVTRSPPKSVVTYTTADVNLFVDPTGSDTGACTSTGTAACLTLQGAFNKAPKMLRHKLTVTAAAGNYAGVTISGFTIDPAFQKTTAGILLDGALANVTPATGTATGTATAGTAGSGSTFGTLTDGAQTWTINDAALVGKFVNITGGTGSGQVRVIVSNTATVLTIAGTWTAPTGTSTYALQSPSVNITSVAAAVPVNGAVLVSGAGSAGIQVLDNNTNATFIVVRNVGISIAASKALLARGSLVSPLQMITTGMTTGISFDIGERATATVLAVSTESTIGSGVAASGPFSAITVFHSRIKTTSTSATAISSFGDSSKLVVGAVQLESAKGILVSTGSSFSTSGAGVRCDCLSAANSYCLTVSNGNSPGTTSAGTGTGSTASLVTNMNVTNCDVGIFSYGDSTVGMFNTVVVSGNALTYAFDAVNGGSITTTTTAQTITGGTAEMSVDTGSATGAFSTLAASFNCLMAVGTTSRICRQ